MSFFYAKSRTCSFIVEKMENREVLLKYGKNPVFYSGDREDTGFLLITSGSAAQSSIIDDFATLPFIL